MRQTKRLTERQRKTGREGGREGGGEGGGGGGGEGGREGGRERGREGPLKCCVYPTHSPVLVLMSSLLSKPTHSLTSSCNDVQPLEYTHSLTDQFLYCVQPLEYTHSLTH